MKSSKLVSVFAIAAIFAAPRPSIAIAGTEPDLQALEWRNVGPHVGVRGSGVAMHPTDRNVFYHAHSSGGVWKTEDAGQYWIPITDGQINVGAVGAIAVSPTNPDIIYIGTGEPQLRDCVSWGDGAYKSTDGGDTWTHIGLKETRHIARVRIHPENPDLVYVAAIGNPFGPSRDRGIYRSKDGGKTWKQRTGTKDDESKQQAGGSPSSLETSGQEAYNTIHRMVASPISQGMIWTGSDDGLVHLTRDGG